MKGRVLLIGEMGAGRTGAALVADGVVEDFAIDPPSGVPPHGAVVAAKVGRPAQGKQAFFAETVSGSSVGEPLFIRANRALRQGEEVQVQLGAYAEDGKARPATTDILHKSRFFVLTPGRPGLNVSRQIRDTDEAARLRMAVGDVVGETGLIIRTAAAGQPVEVLEADVAALLDDAAGGAASSAHRMAECEWTAEAPDFIGYTGQLGPLIPSLEPLAREGDSDPFEHFGVWDALAAALDDRLDLDGSAWMSVEPTRALVAVDVNSGADFSHAAGLKANTAAIRALPRALRLRGLGGQIVVDAAPLAKKDRRQIEQTLKATLRRDPIETSFAGWTPLGHMELQRKRERWPLRQSDIEELTP